MNQNFYLKSNFYKVLQCGFPAHFPERDLHQGAAAEELADRRHRLPAGVDRLQRRKLADHVGAEGRGTPEAEAVQDRRQQRQGHPAAVAERPAVAPVPPRVQVAHHEAGHRGAGEPQVPRSGQLFGQPAQLGPSEGIPIHGGGFISGFFVTIGLDYVGQRLMLQLRYS